MRVQRQRRNFKQQGAKRKERDAKKKDEREDMIRKGNAKTWNQPRLGRWARGEGGRLEHHVPSIFRSKMVI